MINLKKVMAVLSAFLIAFGSCMIAADQADARRGGGGHSRGGGGFHGGGGGFKGGGGGRGAR